MANTFYSYLAFIQPSSDTSLLLLKENLVSFYDNEAITDKPDIILDDNQINVIFNDGYQLYILLSEEKEVNHEANEFADEYELDWNENPFDKEKLKSCKKRFEVWGDDDFDMDYFNDSLFVIEQIEKFTGILIFDIQ